MTETSEPASSPSPKPPPSSPTPPRDLVAFYLRSGAILSCVVAGVAGIGALILATDGTVRQIVVCGLLFGLWTLGCVLVGDRLGRGKSAAQARIDVERMFNWIRTGKADGKNGDQKPPVDMPEPKRHSFRL